MFLALQAWSGIVNLVTYAIFLIFGLAFLLNPYTPNFFSTFLIVSISIVSANLLIVKTDKYSIYSVKRHFHILLLIVISFIFGCGYFLKLFEDTPNSVSFAAQLSIILSFAILFICVGYVYPLYLHINYLKRMDIEQTILDHFGFAALLAFTDNRSSLSTVSDSNQQWTSKSIDQFTFHDIYSELEFALEQTRIHSLQLLSLLPLIACPFIVSFTLFLINSR